MHIRKLHPWDLDTKQAADVQRELAAEVILTDRLDPIEYVAGIDVGYEDGNTVTRAAVAVLNFPSLTLADWVLVKRPTTFPYIPGYLSFREVPAIIDALEQLKVTPNILFCDGHGTIHPRRFGIACHLGILTGLPAVGVGKTPYVGKHDPLADTKGSWQPIRHKEEVIGAAVRTRVGVKPIYVSPGHRICLETAISLVLKCTLGYKQPETTRWSHRLASGPPIPEEKLAGGLTLS